MKKICVFIMSLLCTLALCGCGSEDTEISGATKPLEILLTDTDYLQLDIPVELQIIKRDNLHYWELSANVGIYRMTSKTTTARLDEESGLYISKTAVIRNFDNCCVVINCSGSLQEYFKTALANAAVKQKDTNTYKEYAIKSLPAHNEMTDMELVNDLYMPPNCEDVLYDIYASKLYTSGTDWLQSMIVDAKLEDLKPRLVTIASLNSGKEGIQEWWESDDIFYCATDSCVVAAKKLAFNSWYVYQGSPSMLDYILTGVNKVHGQSSKG